MRTATIPCSFLAAALLCIRADATAQVTLPPAATTANPMPAGELHLDCNLFPANPGAPSLIARTQLVFDAADVGLAPVTFQSLRFRPPELALIGGPGPGVAYTADVVITMSNGLQPAAATQNTFANNHGPSPVVVYSGTVNLPEQITTPWPTAWEQPLQFQQPFPYVGAATAALVIDIEVSNIVCPHQLNWIVEWHDVDVGDGRPIANACELTVNPGVTPAVLAAPPVLGLPFAPLYTGYPINDANLLWNVHLWGDALPSAVPLLNLGLPVAQASCELGVVPLFTENLIYAPSLGQLQPAAPFLIPATPSLAGVKFATQPASLDITVAGVGFHTGPGFEWTVGSGSGLPGIAMVSAQSSLGVPSQGRLRVGSAVTIELQ